MTKPNIYFRADGNTEIGLGHITRCLALADMLKENFHCIFLVQNPAKTLQVQIQENFDLIIVPQTQNYSQEAEFIRKTYLKENDIMVLDGYNFQTEYQKIIKNINHSTIQPYSLIKLVCIDDLHAWHFVADAIINHAGGVLESDYSHESYTKLYLGADYALLRKPFLEAAKKERKIEKIEKVFICFGGSDIHNLSQKATEACLKIEKFTEIHVVLGSAYPYFQEFTNFAQKHEKVQIHQNLNAQEMCDLMQHCQLALAPASSIAYEICAVGMYLVVGWYVENQKGIYQFLMEKHLGIATDNFQNIDKILENNVINSEILDNQQKFFHGNFDKKLRTIFYQLIITMRKAEQKDIYLYFDWANEPTTRRNSLNTKPIDWETHQKWFLEKVQNKNSLLYIFEIHNQPIGQVRIDIENEVGRINYALDLHFRGLGLAEIILQKVIEAIKIIKNIMLIAEVKKENIPSKRTFEKLKFSVQEFDNRLIFSKNI